jgi:hypothetical protein
MFGSPPVEATANGCDGDGEGEADERQNDPAHPLLLV